MIEIFKWGDMDVRGMGVGWLLVFVELLGCNGGEIGCEMGCVLGIGIVGGGEIGCC